MKASILLAAVAVLGTAIAIAPFQAEELTLPRLDASSISKFDISKTTGRGLYRQLIDHDDPSKGTFLQRYWWNSTFWAEPGSPIIMYNLGESMNGAWGLDTNGTIIGAFAQEIKGATILIEHRYFGYSFPYFDSYFDLNPVTLQYLTVKQSIADMVNFAKNVDLPFDTNHSSNADNSPWVLSGASYSGSLAAWTEKTAPGTFWAYHASSAPVQAVDNFWQYFSAAQQGMPKNCSKDVAAVVDYMDGVLQYGTPAAKHALKTKFGMGGEEDNVYFMYIVKRHGPGLWQKEVGFNTGYSEFFKFCDAVENVTLGAAITPDENGVGLEVALEGYASYVAKQVVRNSCAASRADLDCMNMQNVPHPLHTTRIVDKNEWRQYRLWSWLLCNEPLMWSQTGAPADQPTIISRLFTPELGGSFCAENFPATPNGLTYGSVNSEVNVDSFNEHYGGWYQENTTRLVWVNGEYDPWRWASVASPSRPGGPLISTAQHPSVLIPGGFHCSDMDLASGEANAGAQEAIRTVIDHIVTWVGEYSVRNKG